MNRDSQPTPGGVAAMTAELLVAGKRTAAAHAGLPLPDLAAATIKAITPLWAHVLPEAARDVMITCADTAAAAGWAGLPADVASRFSAHELIAAADQLVLTAEWIANGRPGTAGFTPPQAFASSVAFDRAEDAETLVSVGVLLALAHGPGPAR